MTTKSSLGSLKHCRIFTSLVTLFLLASASHAQTPANVVEITPGLPLAREIAAGRKESILIRASAGQMVRGILTQKGTDLIIRVTADPARWTVEFDSQLRYEGSEPIEFVADESGSYQIEVEAKKGAPSGGYILSILEISIAEDRDKKLHDARMLLSRAAAQSRSGKYPDAIKTAEAALEIREDLLGHDSPEVAVILNRIGIYYFSLGDSEKSFEHQKAALAIYEKDPARDAIAVSEVRNNLGVHLRLQGDFAGAEKEFLYVLGVRERVFGPDAYILGTTLNNLGLLYRVRGDYDAAERSYERSIRVREQRLGDSDLDLQYPLTNLAAVAYYKGDYSGALKIDERVRAIREKNLPAGHPLIGESIYNIAVVTSNLGDLDTAERLLLQAVQIHEKSYGPDSSQHIDNYLSLGNLYRERGDLTRARDYMDRALRISRLQVQTDPLKHADGLIYSARLRILENDLKTAEAELIECLTIRERVLGTEHDDVRAVLSAMAALQAKSGNIPAAVDLQSRANAIGERQLAVNLVFGTEHQRLSYAASLRADEVQTLALHAYLAPSDKRVRDLAANVLLQRKGRVFDATAFSFDRIRKHLTGEDTVVLNQLSDTAARLSALMLSGRRAGDNAFGKNLAELQSKKDLLEQQLSRRSAGYYQPQKTYTVDDAKTIVPPNAALIEFALVTKMFGPDSAGARPAEYVAYVIRRGHETEFVNLGDSTKIDTMTKRFRGELRDPSRRGAAKLGRELDEALLRPIRSLVGNATHILLSLEGELNLLPFEALINERGRYAVEKFRFTYLTSGRDLFRSGSDSESLGAPVIVANPSFGDSASLPTGSTSPSAIGPATRSMTTGKRISEVYFAPLRGTAAEAAEIKKYFPESKLLTGSEATVAAIRALKAPKILHLATHGFFLEDSEAKRGIDGQLTQIESPLARSGIALAGANMRNAEQEDGLLTALEAAGLNLSGTKLVVLSACDTGLGEIRNGEGVYGLRRSFALAGAESLVMSLWPVSDQVTRELMTGYYRNLKKGLGRGEALRQVRLEMIRSGARKHPFYWASFIQSGEWANLDGQR
ncbi:MAG: CHAT domain-containing tetratricopeptide repeat protein [Pyrinomonadaceae bacterium]